MNKKIIFIINSVQNQRCIKRINDFIDHGYFIIAYGYKRNTTIHTKPEKFEIEILDSIPNKKFYFFRLYVYLKNFNKIYKKYKNDNVIFYFFGLDIALIGSIFTHSFIYEESDLSHTYIRNKHLVKILELIDRYIISRSKLTIFTSEGFLNYHFNDKDKFYNDKILVIPNKLNKEIIKLNYNNKKSINIKKLRIAFVGGARFKSVLNFADVVAKNFPNHEIHFYGNPVDLVNSFQNLTQQYNNVFFHGPFRNPIDLPKIYENIDLLISTYDVEYDNIKYAEPNKLYESIYFEVPIIVTNGTFLSKKVNELKIGFSLDPLNDIEIVNLFNNISLELINEKIESCRKIPKNELIDDNTLFFSKLKFV